MSQPQPHVAAKGEKIGFVVIVAILAAMIFL